MKMALHCWIRSGDATSQHEFLSYPRKGLAYRRTPILVCILKPY